MTNSSEMWLPAPLGSVLGGKYRLAGVLGRGGMGVVCSAIRVADGVELALKFACPSRVGGAVSAKRLLAEANAAGRIRHAHVVTVLDAGETEQGIPFIAMERLHGQTLQQRLEAGPVHLATAIALVSQVCEGLTAAHELGVVHRDISPSNLYLCSTSSSFTHIKILDFGLAREGGRGTDATSNPWLLGSAPYMPPEYIENGSADARSDIWSLGVVFYEMISGSLPFHGSCAADTLVAILTRPPAALVTEESVSAGVEAILRRCLCKHPADRFQTAAELRDALAWAADPDWSQRDQTAEQTIEFARMDRPWG